MNTFPAICKNKLNIRSRFCFRSGEKERECEKSERVREKEGDGKREFVGIKTLSAKSNKRGIKYASLSKTEKQHLIFTATS